MSGVRKGGVIPFRLNPSSPLPSGRITIYREPEPGRTYCLGFDCGLGLESGDASAGVMLDDRGEQVLTGSGQWGHTSFVPILTPICEWYQPFIVGENAAGGLEVNRALFSLGFWLYFDRDEKKRGKPVTDKLGHWPVRYDPPIKALQSALGPRAGDGSLMAPRVVIRDAELHGQLCKYGYRPRSSTVSMEAAHDDQLVWGAPPGEHDDLVRACALSVWGLEWLPLYEKPKPTFKPKQIGHVLKHEAVLNPPEDDAVSHLDRLSRRKPRSVTTATEDPGWI